MPDSPAAVQRAPVRAKLRGVVEAFVAGLEEPPVRTQNSSTPRPGLPSVPNRMIRYFRKNLRIISGAPEVLDRRREFDVGVGILVQQRRDFVHVVVEHGHAHSRSGLRMLGMHVSRAFSMTSGVGWPVL
jgi:hypothetical protein